MCLTCPFLLSKRTFHQNFNKSINVFDCGQNFCNVRVKYQENNSHGSWTCSTISSIRFISLLQVLHHLWLYIFFLQLALDKRDCGLDVLALIHRRECRPKSRSRSVHGGGNISSEQKPQQGADWAPANNAVFPLDFFFRVRNLSEVWNGLF